MDDWEKNLGYAKNGTTREFGKFNNDFDKPNPNAGNDIYGVAKKLNNNDIKPNAAAVHPLYINQKQYKNLPKLTEPPKYFRQNGALYMQPPKPHFKTTENDAKKREEIKPIDEAIAMGSWIPHTVQDGYAYKQEQTEAYKQQQKLNAQKAKNAPNVFIPHARDTFAPGVDILPGPSLAQLQQQGYNYAEMMRAKQRKEAANKIPPPGPIHTPEHNPAHATGPQSKTPVQQQTQRGTTRPEQAKPKTFLPQFFSTHQKPHQSPPRVPQQYQSPPRVPQQQNYYNDPRRGLVPQQYGYTVQPQPGIQMRPVQHHQNHYIDHRRGHVPQQYRYTVPHTVPQQPQFYYYPGNFRPNINRGVGESAEMSSDMFDEDDLNEIIQHDQIKQNASKDNCYLVETTAL